MDSVAFCRCRSGSKLNSISDKCEMRKMLGQLVQVLKSYNDVNIFMAHNKIN